MISFGFPRVTFITVIGEGLFGCPFRLRVRPFNLFFVSIASLRKGLPNPELFDVRYRKVSDAERRHEQEHSVGMWVRGESLVRVQAQYNSLREIKQITISRVAETKAEVQ